MSGVMHANCSVCFLVNGPCSLNDGHYHFQPSSSLRHAQTEDVIYEVTTGGHLKTTSTTHVQETHCKNWRKKNNGTRY